jgi:hypothetical protein
MKCLLQIIANPPIFRAGKTCENLKTHAAFCVDFSKTVKNGSITTNQKIQNRESVAK